MTATRANPVELQLRAKLAAIAAVASRGAQSEDPSESRAALTMIAKDAGALDRRLREVEGR